MQRLNEGSGVLVWTPGRPRTKGSLIPRHLAGRAGKRCKVWLTEDGEHSAAWKDAMVRAIRAACVCERYAGPVEVHAFFRFEREGPEMDIWPIGRQYGDEDKLRRNLLDALTQSALLADDSLVVGGQTWKRFVAEGEAPGAGVTFIVAPSLDPGDAFDAEMDAAIHGTEPEQW